MRPKLYPIERKVGSSRCGNPRCQVCTSIQITDNFSSFATKSVYKISYNYNCNSKTQAPDSTKGEYYWMRTLQCLYPDGFNLESDTYLFRIHSSHL